MPQAIHSRVRARAFASGDDAAPLGAGYAHAVAIRSASGKSRGRARPQVSPRLSTSEKETRKAFDGLVRRAGDGARTSGFRSCVTR